jgi:hypothetical protein
MNPFFCFVILKGGKNQYVQVQQEKEEAQQRLDQEQEYVVNKLRRELSSVVSEKE